jgi:hypothetical protein
MRAGTASVSRTRDCVRQGNAKTGDISWYARIRAAYIDLCHKQVTRLQDEIRDVEKAIHEVSMIWQSHEAQDRGDGLENRQSGDGAPAAGPGGGFLSPASVECVARRRCSRSSICTYRGCAALTFSDGGYKGPRLP